MRGLLRAVGLLLVRIFYRAIAVTGRERLPQEGPVIAVANHPNGLLDPLVVRVALGREVAFLAKSTLFRGALGRTAMAAFDAIPVYRPRDGVDPSRNEATFERCRALLAARGWLVLFPEGTSHSDPRLRPLKTGAARIALGARAEAGPGLGLRIVPLGLLYEDKAIFRSRVAVAVGAPLALDAEAARFAGDERAAVDALSARISDALAEVVLEADSQELWRGFLAVAAWTSADGGRELGAREGRARALAGAYRRLVAAQPERAAQVVDATRRYVQVLEAVGVVDPLALEDAARARPRLRGVALLAALALPALVGVALGWAPYRLVRPLARRLAREPDVEGTVKALLGLVLLVATWAAEGLAAGLLWGAGAGLLTIALGPLCGFVALRVGERLERRRAALTAWWLRATRQRVAHAMAAQRAELCRLVEAALAESQEAAAP